jgi:hypothetical protein
MWVRLFDFTTGDEIGELPMGSFWMLVGCKDLFDILDCLHRHITDVDCLFQRNLLSLNCPMCHKLPSDLTLMLAIFYKYFQANNIQTRNAVFMGLLMFLSMHWNLLRF